MLLVLFGLFLSLLLLEIGMRMAGWAYASFQEERNKHSLTNNAKYRILCLGESTTAMGRENSWPSQLERILNKEQKKKQFCVINKGMPGAYTSNIVEKFDEFIALYHPQVIIVMMGINDTGEVLPYENTAYQNTLSFFQSFRIYKLYRFLLTRMNQNSFCTPYDQGIVVSTTNEPIKFNFKDRQEIFLKDLNMCPKDERVWMYIAFAWECRDNGKFEEAEDMFRLAIKEGPENYCGYHDLGMCYKAQGKYIEAETMFKKAIEKNPGYDWGYIEIGWIYHAQDKDNLAEEMFNKAAKINPEGDRAYGSMALLYAGQPDSQEEKFYAGKVKMMRLNNFNPVTRKNYRILKEKVERAGAKLMCVQYPVRSAQQLKRMLTDYESIIFVDNERIFKEALLHGKYTDYFEDSFAGDFGHCTKKGNNLLAQNIAKAVLKYYLYN